MKYAVLQMPQFRDDLFYAVRYITNELQNPAAAVKLLEAVEKSVQSLEELPNRCVFAAAPGLRQRGIRMLFVRSYCILFVVDDTTQRVSLLRFGLAARNWKELV